MPFPLAIAGLAAAAGAAAKTSLLQAVGGTVANAINGLVTDVVTPGIETTVGGVDIGRLSIDDFYHPERLAARVQASFGAPPPPVQPRPMSAFGAPDFTAEARQYYQLAEQLYDTAPLGVDLGMTADPGDLDLVDYGGDY